MPSNPQPAKSQSQSIDQVLAFRASRPPAETSSWIFLLSYAAVGVVCAVMTIGADRLGSPEDAKMFFTIGVLGAFGLLFTLPIFWVLLARKKETGTGIGDPAKLDSLANAIRQLTEQSALSPEARRVLNRRLDRDLLFRAIEEDIAVGEWDAGMVLCDELANRFGYRAEAEAYRARVESARGAEMDHNVADAISRLDGLIVQRRWDLAIRESASIKRRFPDSHRVENLRQRVEHAKAVYKVDLERRFLDAAERDQIDEAMDFLKELDAYLTESDAEPYREVARGVIGKAKENLGAQFKIAVRDKEWGAAAAIGKRIINEFPNTRMATEVRGLLDGILTRANAMNSAATT
ncbi:MAG: hypothetical protein H7210_01050 [Pyrinomonadaceae bacterium]|nr:hypothetical protein [Phycisphaerales bacterium]